MTSVDVEKALKELPKSIRFAFAPVVKRALGFAFGLYLGGAIALLTLYHQIFDPEHTGHLWLLRNYFFGYDPEALLGPLVGFLWGAWTGFVAGWMLAAVRNFGVGVWIFWIRTKTNLKNNREFLDHI